MEQLEPRQGVIVFDLDDTLYQEIDYKTSGHNAVCQWMQSVYGRSLCNELQSLRAADVPDLLGELCRLAGLPVTVKESLLWVYRLHHPRINLAPEIAEFLRNLNSNFHVVILTDGRSLTQRLKLKALALDHLPTYISEEYGSEKPSSDRFELIMRDLPAEGYVYVGDNPKKDFIAPNALGWRTFGVRDQGRNIHTQNLEGLGVNQLPNQWINSLEEILDYLC
jgi:putative hydrolase of the HAD superfamily